MPLTPFHFGPALLVGLLLLRYVDFPTFVIAGVIVDIEPMLVLAFDLNYPFHGFFHSFIGGIVVALLLAAVMTKIREFFSPLISFFRLEQKTSFGNILLASFSGICLHILLDSRMYCDIRPFYPLEVNPFLDQSAMPEIWLHTVLVWCFFGAAIIYVLRLFLVWRKRE